MTTIIDGDPLLKLGQLSTWSAKTPVSYFKAQARRLKSGRGQALRVVRIAVHRINALQTLLCFEKPGGFTIVNTLEIVNPKWISPSKKFPVVSEMNDRSVMPVAFVKLS